MGAFDADIRAYAANLNAKALDAALAADFVQAVEPVAIVRAHHDTAVAGHGRGRASAPRRARPGLFSGVGGASVPIGVMDTGLNINHLDIASNRESICGANFVSAEPRAEDNDLWVDEGEHGTPCHRHDRRQRRRRPALRRHGAGGGPHPLRQGT